MTSTSQQTLGFRRRIDTHPESPGGRPHTEGPASVPSTFSAERNDSRGISPLRKAAIVLVSLEQSSASNLLSKLDRAAVEAVTWEIARLDRIDPSEQQLVLDEFFDLGLRRLCFVFDDLIKLADEDLQQVYHAGEARTWALALASAAPPLRAKVLGALAPTAAHSLRDTLEHLGPFRLADAESAQAEIAERFRNLSDQGIVVLPEPSGHDDLLV